MSVRIGTTSIVEDVIAVLNALPTKQFNVDQLIKKAKITSTRPSVFRALRRAEKEGLLYCRRLDGLLYFSSVRPSNREKAAAPAGAGPWLTFEQIQDSANKYGLPTDTKSLKRALDYLHMKGQLDFTNRPAAKGVGVVTMYRMKGPSAVPAPAVPAPSERFFLLTNVTVETFDNVERALAAWTLQKTNGSVVRLFRGVEVKPTLTAKL